MRPLMRPILPFAAAAGLVAGCGETTLAPFGQLSSPAALAVHQRTGTLFIASLGADELKVFDAVSESFLTAPAALFPLSIPTVSNPVDLAAGERFVFVLGGAGAELGFVDTQVPPGAAGPRSVDVGGFPLTLPLDMVPTDLEAFSSTWAWDASGLADHALVVGLDGAGQGGVLLVARPPVLDGEEILALPRPEAALELSGIYPSALALDPSPAAPAGLRDASGAPVADCRPLAIADGRLADGHAPAIWITRVRVLPDGTLSVDPLESALRVEIRVPLELADGTVVERIAPIRDIAFAPAPMADSTLAALATDPCALRSGRLYAVLDASYCGGAATCPDVAVVDLAGPSGPALAPDARDGGVALYDFPGAILSVTALSGPFDLPGAYAPGLLEGEGRNPRLSELPALGLLASSNGALYYLAGGLGPYLVGPGPEARAPIDAAFPVDAEAETARVSVALARTDTGIRGSALSTPTVAVPEGSHPRDERWTLGYLRPLPGLGELGRLDSIGADGGLNAPSGVSFTEPVAVRADSNPRLADRVVPASFSGAVCEGFPVIAVEAGRLVVDRGALANDPACLEPALPLRLLPPLDEPWWISGAQVGFVGRLSAAVPSEVVVGSEVQFLFTPPQENPPANAAYAFTVSDGFRFYAADPGDFGELPASVAPYLRAGPRAGRDPDWRVFVSYSGTDALGILFPTAPDDFDFFQ